VVEVVVGGVEVAFGAVETPGTGAACELVSWSTAGSGNSGLERWNKYWGPLVESPEPLVTSPLTRTSSRASAPHAASSGWEPLRVFLKLARKILHICHVQRAIATNGANQQTKPIWLGPGPGNNRPPFPIFAGEPGQHTPATTLRAGRKAGRLGRLRRGRLLVHGLVPFLW